MQNTELSRMPRMIGKQFIGMNYQGNITEENSSSERYTLARPI